MGMTDHYPYPYEPVTPYGGYEPSGPAATPAAPSRRRGLLIGFGSGLLAAALIVGGVALANPASSPIAGSGSITRLLPTTPGGSGTGPGGTAPGGSGSSGSSKRSTGNNGAATAAQRAGVVTIVSTLKYQMAQSAGTGMVLSSDGEILTNNHVVNGATSIVVTVPSTGASYRATVVGTSPTSDIAVLKLRGAAGLHKAALAPSAANVGVGDTVTGVGNAGGTGSLTAASGRVTALNQSITASDQTGQASERLTGLIQVNAKIISGDSGGPLYDASGTIVGIDTAASVNRGAPTSAAYAIPIEHAVKIATQIESGVRTTSIHIGYPGFLGVSTQVANGAGAGVADLLQGGPAAAAGITPGSVITAVDGTPVASPDALRAVLVAKGPGKRVAVTWSDAHGTTHTATVTLATGPAD